jgi:NADH-quinone oxidoreductase subunit N
MQASDLTALLPLLVTGGASVVLMAIVALKRCHALAAGFTAASLLAALALVPVAQGVAPHQDTLFAVDSYGLYFVALILVTGLLVVCLAYGYFERLGERQEEFYLLLLLGVAGAGFLAVSSHFVSLFVSLELLSVSLYAMIAYPRIRSGSVEAAIKYLVLGSASAALLLFGAGLAYARLGSMDLGRIAQALMEVSASSDVILLAGIALLFSGAAFKLGVAPFHLWAPDVYEGAPAPVGAVIATISKAAMTALVFRYFATGQTLTESPLLEAAAVVSAVSMLVGNLLALLQSNLKRLLAYSSISHLGYVLVALLAAPANSREAAAFYMAAYAASLIVAFGVMSALGDGVNDADHMESYRGLFRRRPALGLALTLSMFSLAGIPLTAGFVGKFYVVLAGADRALWTLLLILAASSTLSLYYYLRVVVLIYDDSPTSSPAAATPGNGSFTASLALTASAVMIVALGVFPQQLIGYLNAAVALLLR